MRALIVILIVVLVVLGIWYVVSQGTGSNTNTYQSNTNRTTQNVNRSNANATANTNASGAMIPDPNANTTSPSPLDVNGNVDIVDYAIDMGEYSFSPNAIVLEPGETIQVKLTNTGTTDHDFRVDELGVNSELIAPGASKTISITGTREGVFAVYCSVGSHQSLGMEGTVTVGTQ